MLGDKNLARSGVSCVLLAYLAGEIWETAVTSNSNQRSTGMSPCSPMNPPVLKSFHAVQVCWAGLGRMINHLVLEWLFGGQLKQNKTTQNTMGEISEGQSILWHTCQSYFFRAVVPFFFPLENEQTYLLSLSLLRSGSGPHHFTLAQWKLFSHWSSCLLSLFQSIFLLQEGLCPKISHLSSTCPFKISLPISMK